MKELYKRFGIQIDKERAEQAFIQKLKNILTYGEFGQRLFDKEQKTHKLDFFWEISNKLGVEYEGTSEEQYDDIFPDVENLAFEERLLRFQLILDILWENEQKDLAIEFANNIQDYVGESPVNLGLKVVVYKKRAPQIYFGGGRLLHKAIEETLDLLESQNYPEVTEHFETGIKEFLRAKNKSQFKDVVEDMITACDVLVQTIFKDKNLGMKHLFKDRRWEKIHLNVLQKEIFQPHLNWMNKMKHNTFSDYEKEDIEAVIHITAAFIKLVVSKNVQES